MPFRHPDVDDPCLGLPMVGHNNLRMPLGALTKIQALWGSGLFSPVGLRTHDLLLTLRGSVSLLEYPEKGCQERIQPKGGVQTVWGESQLPQGKQFRY